MSTLSSCVAVYMKDVKKSYVNCLQGGVLLQDHLKFLPHSFTHLCLIIDSQWPCMGTTMMRVCSTERVSSCNVEGNAICILVLYL